MILHAQKEQVPGSNVVAFLKFSIPKSNWLEWVSIGVNFIRTTTHNSCSNQCGDMTDILHYHLLWYDI